MTLLFKLLNPIMKAILRSPFHGMISSRIMIITFTGRRTGKQYSTPVSYFKDGGMILCATHSTWWKNIGAGSEVGLRISGKEVRGQAIAVNDDLERKSELLYKLLVAVPGDAAFYGIKLGEDGKPSKADVERVAVDAVVIKINLINPDVEVE
jgi:deazaflavin-dependent oxidoreductase (nitroreductase family)